MRNALQEMSSQVLPDQVSQLLQNVMDELNQRARSGVELVSVCAGGVMGCSERHLGDDLRA